MAKIIDISAKLTNERPKIKLTEDKTYEIDDRKNTVLSLNQKMSEVSEGEAVDIIISTLLGEVAAKEIEAMDLSISDYEHISLALMAAVSNEEYEETERRFREKKGI